jgi:tRNA (mo5U34)-methyltransferase
MQRGSDEVEPVADDYHFWQTQVFEKPSFPRMYFIEKRYSGDPTNWWIPNRACAEAMLRSAGFEVLSHPEQEVFVCRWKEVSNQDLAVYPTPG